MIRFHVPSFTIESGHLVSGHVDGLTELITREDLTDMAKLTLRVPKPLGRFIAQKGRLHSLFIEMSCAVPRPVEFFFLGKE